MKPSAPSRRNQRGVSLVVGVASLVVIIPMVGLSVDIGYLYAAKARLQAAVDGASLAAARALVLGATTAQQASAAQQNAVNWFYADFPAHTWSTSHTVMGTANVQVYDDATNPNLRHVDLVASTSVPTIFMRWLHFNSTTITSTGHASRRDSVITIVLDRSGSMCQGLSQPCNNTGACGPMKTAAKLFTGQFAANRDYIGMVSFSDGTYVHSAPTRNFRTVLGYNTGSASGNGAIDTIQCQGGTNTAQAIALGYNEIYKTALPGALNVLLFESDGLPNTMTVNMWDGAAFGFASLGSVASPQGCKDSTGKAKVSGGWATFANRTMWLGTASPTSSPGSSYNTGVGAYSPSAPAGALGALYSSDPSGGTGFIAMFNPYHPSGNYGGTSLATGTNCKWSSTSSDTTDFAWMPATDVWGNKVNPPSHPYKAVTMNGTHLKFDSSQTASAKWTNYHNAALNAADNAAYQARSNATIAANVFVIGLGGNGGDPVDHTLMQRIANDPNGDTTVPYVACASNPACYTYPSPQPQGTYIFSSNSTVLKAAFLKLSSQILRLSQ